jgi:hypothetical protein
MKTMRTMLSASLLLLVYAGPALAGECWENVTAEACPIGSEQRLAFRNRCVGAKTVNVCLKWISGEQAGIVERLTAKAPKDHLAEIDLGACNSGQFTYTHRTDGAEPNCPQ